MKQFVLILLSVLTTACGKETTVQGIVQENNTGTPIPGASVFLEQQINSNRTDRRQTVTADANGEYKISFSANKQDKYGVDGMADLCSNVAKFLPVTIGKSNNVNIILETQAFVRVHAVRTSANDTLWLGRSVRRNDTTYLWPLKGNEDDFLVYLIKTGDTFVTHQVPFHIAAFQTKDFLLEF